MPDEIVIPDKPAFKAAEVCELLKLQPYVLKSWENEFKDLGVSKTAGGPRVYRRVDVERAVRIRELVLREGLTLAGVRRRLEQDAATADVEEALIAEISAFAPAAAAVTAVDRERVAQVKQGLRALLDTLSRPAAPVAPAATAVTGVGAAHRAALDLITAPAASTDSETAGGVGAAHRAARDPIAVPAASTDSETAGGEGAAHRAARDRHASPESPVPPRELTIVADEAPSLFAEDEAVVARDPAPPTKPAGKRKRSPRVPEPDAN